MKVSQYLKEEKGAPVFSPADVEEFAARLRTELTGPAVEHVNIKTSTFANNVSILVLVIFDPKPSWINGIMENARIMRFHIEQPNVIRQFTKGYKLDNVKKFRKSRVKSQDAAIKKLNDYLKLVPVYK